MRALRFLFPLLLALGACVDTGDDVSNVKDLRVLGVRTDPPEIMAPVCDLRSLAGVAADAGSPDLSIFVLLGDVTVTTLIADPKGMGRSIDYELLTCPSQDDPRCDKDRPHTQVLAKGTTTDGELALTVKPGAVLLPDGPLLAEVVREDQYKGLGGIRQPLVIHLKAGSEEVYAQKLMVFSCRLFPQMKANVNPELPGILLKGAEWKDGEVAQLTGAAQIDLEPINFDALQETYTVPTFQLTPLQLTEAWKVSYFGEEGRFTPTTTGGVDFDGTAEGHKVKWQAYSTDTEADLRFWFVVRDGRGGLTWLKRQAHFKP